MNRSRYGWLLIACLVAAPISHAAPSVPHGRTPAHMLDVAGLRHHEVLRIDPGPLGPSGDYEVVVDAWASSRNPRVVESVEVWWLDRDAADERSPFGPSVKKRIQVEKTRHNAQQWTVAIVTKDDRFVFRIESTPQGQVVAYTAIVEAGRLVDDCLVSGATLVPKRIFGIPVGLRRIDVACVDRQGQPHHGAMD